MDESELLQERLKSNFNKYTRTALLAECADRAINIYAKLGDETDRDEVARSIKIAWDYACNKPVDETEYKMCLAAVDETASFYFEEDYEPLASLLLVIESLLESLSTDEDKSCAAIVRGLTAIIDVATTAEELADEENPVPDRECVAEREEEEWQEKAVNLAEKWEGVADPNMFDSLGGKPTKWMIDLENRCEL